MRLCRPSLLLALRRHLPGRTVRWRLTLVYGGLFLASGAVLLVITGLLWDRATGGKVQVNARLPARILAIAGPPPTSRGAQTFTEARGSAVVRAQKVGVQLQNFAAQQRTSELHQLLLYSGLALGVMVLLSVALGWLMAGRVLRPLRTITSAARRISATNLHERLNLRGPDDELKELGDTVDQLLSRLDRSFQSQRQFVANASHELRTPLATMRASLDVAMAKPGPILHETIVLANRLQRELDHVDRLLESLLALARAQRGPADERAVLSLDLLAASALEDRAGKIADLGLDIGEEDCREARVEGNETLLARMVGNVIDNAVHHNTNSGWIRVRTGVTSRTAFLVVENGGPKLNEDAVRDLAKPFRRLGPERTDSDTGFGLGLSIVAAITEAHGGRLRLRPLEGGGLRVVIELPLAARSLSAVPA